MSKPEIIGYETDPDQYWTAPRMPELKVDGDGTWEWAMHVGHDGELYEDWRLIPPGALDHFMRFHGMKRVYEPRQFHATRTGIGWRLKCRNCNLSALTYDEQGIRPHGLAEVHQCPDLQSVTGACWHGIVQGRVEVR